MSAKMTIDNRKYETERSRSRVVACARPGAALTFPSEETPRIKLKAQRVGSGPGIYLYLTISTVSSWHRGHSKVRLSWFGVSAGSILVSHI